jgi:hypothetical protein
MRSENSPNEQRQDDSAWLDFSMTTVALAGSGWSSSPGEFHPEALTDPYVTLSRHTALHSRGLSLARANRLGR